MSKAKTKKFASGITKLLLALFIVAAFLVVGFYIVVTQFFSSVERDDSSQYQAISEKYSKIQMVDSMQITSSERQGSSFDSNLRSVYNYKLLKDKVEVSKDLVESLEKQGFKTELSIDYTLLSAQKGLYLSLSFNFSDTEPLLEVTAE